MACCSGMWKILTINEKPYYTYIQFVSIPFVDFAFFTLLNISVYSLVSKFPLPFLRKASSWIRLCIIDRACAF